MFSGSNKELVRRVYEQHSKKDIDGLFKMYAPDYVEHLPGGDVSLAQIKEGTADFFKAFPDLTFTIEEMVAEGDKVAFCWRTRGTQTGEYAGIPATGKKIDMKNTAIVRIANGKLAEWWGTLDVISMLQQLGVVKR